MQSHDTATKEVIMDNILCLFVPMNRDLSIDAMLKEIDDVNMTAMLFPWEDTNSQINKLLMVPFPN